MLLFVGLGNPGAKYASHRHNIGFMVADEIARVNSFSNPRNRFSGELSQGVIEEEKITLLKPLTFMNESGRSVGEAMRYFKLEPGNVYVFYDELDLEPGQIRFKTSGGTAGHNGIKSIKNHIGADFHRIRIGIGHPGRPEKVHGYVLSDFAKSDSTWVDNMISAIAANVDVLVGQSPSSFINRVYLATRGSDNTDNSPSPQD